MTKALDVNRVLAGLEDPWATYAAFLWNFMGSVDDISKAEDGSEVSATIEEDRETSHMLVNTTLIGKYAMCSASVKASYATQSNNDLYSKVIHTRARFRQPRCSLRLLNHLKVAPIFQHLIDVAFDETQIKQEDRFDFLTRLLELFGHFFPETVYLGGLLEITQDLVSVEGHQYGETKKTLDAAIEVKVNQGSASGSAQVGYKMDGSGLSTQANCLENFRVTAIGGDPSKVGDPTGQFGWINSTNPPEFWKTIKREGALPIFQKLSLDNQKSIAAVIDAKSREAWINEVLDLAKADGGDFNLPVWTDASGPFKLAENMPLLPYFPKGHLVTLKNWWSSENGIDCYLRAQNGEQRAPDSGRD